MKKLKLLLLCLVAIAIGTKAQIGYQISLLNTATGEPRANETVTVSVTLSNNEGESFYSETKSATTNDFGVLSLSIGNADTFANVDFSKMPFFIEVTANGVMIGKSQILSVPVAEYAKRTGDLTKEMLVGTWSFEYDYYHVCVASYVHGNYQYKECLEYRQKYEFKEDGTGFFSYNNSWKTVGRCDDEGKPNDENDIRSRTVAFSYSIDANNVTISLPVNYNENPDYYTYTNRSFPYINEYLHYDKSTGILGDRYTKK